MTVEHLIKDRTGGFDDIEVIVDASGFTTLKMSGRAIYLTSEEAEELITVLDLALSDDGEEVEAA